MSQKNQFTLSKEPTINPYHQNLFHQSSQSDQTLKPKFQQKPRIQHHEQVVVEKEKVPENNSRTIVKKQNIIIQEVNCQQARNQKFIKIEEINMDKKEDIKYNYLDNSQDQKVKGSYSMIKSNKKPPEQNEDVKNPKQFSQTCNIPQQITSQSQYQSYSKVMPSQKQEKFLQSEITKYPRSEITKNPQSQSEQTKYPKLISQSFNEKNKFPSREFQFEQQNNNTMMAGSTLFTMKFSCNLCQLVSSDKIIYLECKHLYHDYCLNEVVLGQLSNPKFQNIVCLCGTQIKSKVIKANFNSISEALFTKQIEIIKNKYSKYLIKCSNCKFFCVIGNQHTSNCYCPQCETYIKVY